MDLLILMRPTMLSIMLSLLLSIAIPADVTPWTRA